MTMEDERNLDMMVAELEHENRLMRARNERLERELNAVTTERDEFQKALEGILAISRLALWHCPPKRTGEVVPKEHDDKASY